jgi:plasmid stabilization system protein ParE
VKSRVDLTIRPEAVEEIRAAREWYRDQDLDSAAEFLRDLAHSVSILLAAPRAGRSLRRMRARALPLRNFPYLIVYRLHRRVAGIDQVEILAVAHGSRRPGYWRERTR